MACDMVIAASNARFGLPEVKRGLAASSGALFRAARVLPLNVAKYLLATGEDFSPQDGHRLGMVTEVCEPGQALDRAIDLAARINANSPVAVQQSLQAVDKLISADDETAWDITRTARRTVGESEDSKEGVAAFFEKRPPQWTGR